MPTFSIRQKPFNALIWGVLFAIAPILTAYSLAAGGKWIVDETSGCGTSNPFLVPGERIRWYGPCRDGKLDGEGKLIWYQGNRETERNEGSFRNGEFHGDVVTTFPDGQVVYGQYENGVRHGDFVIVRADRRPVRAHYEYGVLKAQAPMSDTEVTRWQRRRGKQATAAAPRRLSDEELRPQAMTRPTIMPPAPATRAIPPPKSADDRMDGEEESHGWWNPGGMWGYLNPLEWGVVDKVTGLFDFADEGDDDKAAAKPAPAPTRTAMAPAKPDRAPVQQAAPAKPAPTATRPVAAPKTAPAPASRPVQPRRRARQPEPYGVTEEEVARNWAGTTKNWYDMSVFLNESHPFATMPDAKATMPIVSGQVGSARVGVPTNYGGARNADQPELADGWHLASPDPITPAAMAYAPRPVPRQDAGAADTLFSRAYRLERTGDFAGAKNLYEQVVMLYPSAPSASLANDRLNAINQALQQNVAATVQPRTNYVTVKPGDKVIAVNSPLPPYSASDVSAESGLSPIHDSPYVSKRVCTRRGLYDEDARWCGVVRRDNGGHLIVEVRDVELKSFGMVGISRSTCTGGAFLTWFSRGSTIRVPKKCMTIGG